MMMMIITNNHLAAARDQPQMQNWFLTCHCFLVVVFSGAAVTLENDALIISD